MDVEVQRLDPLKPTIYELDRSSRCVHQTVNWVYYTLVTSCGLLLLVVCCCYFSLLFIAIFCRSLLFPPFQPHVIGLWGGSYLLLFVICYFFICRSLSFRITYSHLSSRMSSACEGAEAGAAACKGWGRGFCWAGQLRGRSASPFLGQFWVESLEEMMEHKPGSNGGSDDVGGRWTCGGKIVKM